ncbi:carboxymuconolactone decarboxylase family protein [Terribacillus saccharophilus]|uniref:Alkylhydroperoxidase n=1 Tax=Terribacillus saccharophilus TaxID=361277 RepID=A0ABX4GYH0_9BACI|nr:carboxymuconolactone decarboxylase family protein [Terribacillus saccharophilus]PAD35869.1 alkylhydroperoxidase [Terribacillus saccharophilus]PAD96269.1 alkylhydroperoxidase [Terribacillus saccharophilus]PAD99844.1 alkylhydroperoxidase [Terribacillus saccharophilus]
MARITKSKFGRTSFTKLLGHNLEIMTAWSELADILENDSKLSKNLKEQVRRTLAQNNGCTYCKAKGKPDTILQDEKTSVAVGFAIVFQNHHKGDVPDSSFAILKEYFTEAEISELCAFICFTTAQQYFGAMMKLEAEL